MPFNLWCPNEGKAFRMGSGSWGLVAGRRINCPLCVSVHEAMRPTDGPSEPEFAGPSEEIEKLRHVIPVNTNGLAITSGYLGIASVIPGIGLAAIAVGLLALRSIRRHPGVYGRGRAFTGIFLGSFSLVVHTLLLAIW